MAQQLPSSQTELTALLAPSDRSTTKRHRRTACAAGADESVAVRARVLDMYLRYSSANSTTDGSSRLDPDRRRRLAKVFVRSQGPWRYRHLNSSRRHRVQLVCCTSHRAYPPHTITVAVLPEADEVDVALSSAATVSTVYRSSGQGGQSVNTTDSAVRVTYHPGRLTRSCHLPGRQIADQEQGEGAAVLRARLLERERDGQERGARSAAVQIGTGERSERIRTYNFPQSRVTDHRIDYTTRNLAGIMAGDLEELTHALETEEQARALASSGGGWASSVPAGVGGTA